jgi:hypothetical protein
VAQEECCDAGLLGLESVDEVDERVRAAYNTHLARSLEHQAWEQRIVQAEIRGKSQYSSSMLAQDVLVACHSVDWGCETTVVLPGTDRQSAW